MIKLCFKYRLRCIEAKREEFGEKHPLLAVDLCNLGVLHLKQGEYQAAERALSEAKEIYEFHGGQQPQLGSVLCSLATCKIHLNSSDDALTLYGRALNLTESTLGPNHVQCATILNNIATLMKDRGNMDEASKQIQRALTITESALGNISFTALSLNV